jgi:mxaJ protein
MTRLRLAAPVVLAVLAAAGAACRQQAAANPEPAANASAPRTANELRVCSDPNNLPFSNDRLEGFENRIAALLARDLDADVRYTWWSQRRGFIRNTLNSGSCDVVMGLPAAMEMALTTRPYYRSSYVFVTRSDRRLDLESFEDPRLRELRVGVPLVGDDGASSPPAHALSRRGIVRNVVGYSVYGDYREEAPPSALIRAVADGAIDVAIAWGPLAGYFAARGPLPLRIVPVSPAVEPNRLPMTFAISMGVRRKDQALRDRLNAFLERRRADIDAILDEYHVPRVPAPPEGPR